MNKILETLWKEHYAEECATLESKEERALAKKAVNMHNEFNEFWNEESLEKYIEALCEIHSLQAQKAFLKGCALAVAILSAK